MAKPNKSPSDGQAESGDVKASPEPASPAEPKAETKPETAQAPKSAQLSSKLALRKERSGR